MIVYWIFNDVIIWPWLPSGHHLFKGCCQILPWVEYGDGIDHQKDIARNKDPEALIITNLFLGIKYRETKETKQSDPLITFLR